MKMRIEVAILATLLIASSASAQGATGRPLGTPRGSLLAIPGAALAGIFTTIALPFTDEPVLVDGRRLNRGDGWQPLGFAVGDSALTLDFEVTGRAQFDRAEIVFEDGTLQLVNLHGAVRSRGRFELARFERPSAVLGVRVLAR